MTDLRNQRKQWLRAEGITGSPSSNDGYCEIETRGEYIAKSKHVMNILRNRKNTRAYMETRQLQFVCQEFKLKTTNLVRILYLLLLRCFLGWF